MATLAAEVAAEAGAAVAGAGIKKAIGIAKWAVPLLALVAIAIYIAVLKGDIRHLTKENDRLSRWQGAAIGAITAEVPPARRASVTSETADDEIHWLGREYRTASQALADQSNALVIAKQRAVDAQNSYEKALFSASQREKDRQGTRAALTAPNRSTGLTEAEWGKL